MQSKFDFSLDILLPDGGATAEDVIALYKGRVKDDIDQIAWNICEFDDKIQNEKFDNLLLEEWSIKHKKGDDIHLKAKFSVNALSNEFIYQIIEEYMDGFADYIFVTLNGYSSSMGKNIGFTPYPIEWELNF